MEAFLPNSICPNLMTIKLYKGKERKNLNKEFKERSCQGSDDEPQCKENKKAQPSYYERRMRKEGLCENWLN